MNKLTRYYLSRIILVVVFALMFVFLGAQWWLGVLVGVLGLAFFLWAPHSGRYMVQADSGVTAMRRDERTASINALAGRNAFVVLMLCLGGCLLYAQFTDAQTFPVSILGWLLILGAGVYYLSDFILRRKI